MKKSLTAGVVVLIAGLVWVGAGAAAGAKPVRYDKDRGMIEPTLVQRVDPKYPEEARVEKVEGVVVLDAVVDTEGKVTETTPVKDPDARLTKAATEAVLQWRFEPARDAKGKPIAVVYTVTVAFKLQ
jgi:TonB family protein